MRQIGSLARRRCALVSVCWWLAPGSTDVQAMTVPSSCVGFIEVPVPPVGLGGLLSYVVFLNPNVPKCVSGIQQASLLDALVLKVVEYERGNRRGDERVSCCGSRLEIQLLKFLV